MRTEVWVVISGEVEAQVGNVHHRAGADDVIVVPPQRKHRLTAVTDAWVMELAQGEVLKHDIVRYEDDYGRV